MNNSPDSTRTPPFATTFTCTVPDWVVGEVQRAPMRLETDRQKVELVNRLADLNWRDGGGGPFAAVVVGRETGRVVAAGVNRVLDSGLSMAHAEVVALSLAQATRGQWDLGAAGSEPTELVVNWRTCVQCYGAAMWSGITRLVLAGHGDEVEDLTGFDEGPMPEDWLGQFAQRGIEVVIDVDKPSALAVLQAYQEAKEAGRVVVYNARGSGTNL